MSELILQLPETLHQQLIYLAEKEGISVDQYILYSLTRQVMLSYSVQVNPPEEMVKQKLLFTELLTELKTASPDEIATFLSERERVEPEAELTPELIARFQQIMGNQSL